MKKKQSKKPAIPSDPIIKIYNHVFYLLQYLRSLAASKLNPPTEYERTVEGDLTWTKPSVERCWQEFDLYMRLYAQTVHAFAPILQEIRELRRDPIVCDMIFRTFEGKERKSAHLDDAIDFIERGFHLFRRLIEEGGYFEERTEKVFYRQAAVCSRIWRDHDYTPSEITTLEAGLKWESAWIHNRRKRPSGRTGGNHSSLPCAPSRHSDGSLPTEGGSLQRNARSGQACRLGDPREESAQGGIDNDQGHHRFGNHQGRQNGLYEGCEQLIANSYATLQYDGLPVLR